MKPDTFDVGQEAEHGVDQSGDWPEILIAAEYGLGHAA
jgi:hypothetical protein